MPKLDDFEPSGLSAYGQNIAENKRGALGAGLASGYEGLKGLGYNAGAAVADVVGADQAKAWLEKQANEKEYQSFVASRPELERIEDQSLGSALPYAGYQIAKQLPNMVGAIGMGVLAPEAAVPAALSRAGAILPRALGGGGLEAGASVAARRAAAETGQTFGKQIVGGAAFNEGQAVGSLYQSAREGGDEHAGRTALLASPAYALAETLPEAMLVGRMAHGSGFSGNFIQRSLKAGATQGAAGATSEIAQTGMEQAVGKELTSEERRSQFLNAGVAGGLVEGLLGLPGGMRARSPINRATGSNEIADALKAKDAIQPAVTTQQFLAGTTQQSLAVPPPAAPAAPITNAPAVNGGSTDIALAQQQATLENQKAQAAQQQEQARTQVIDAFKITADPARSSGQFFGLPVYGPQRVNAVADALAKATAHYDPLHVQIANAIQEASAATSTPEAKTKLLNFSFNADNIPKSVQSGLDAIAKVATKFQIDHVTSVEEAAKILDTLSNSVPKGQLEQVNAIHQALTGKDTSGYVASQQSQAAKGAKNGKVQQPVQNNAGIREVPVAGGTAEDVAGGNGPVRPAEVQPVGAAGVGEGSLGLQVGQPPAGGVRSGTASIAAGNGNGQPASNAQVSGAANEQTQNSVGGGQASGQPKQTAATSMGQQAVQNGPRVYATPPQYYATDLSHIQGERRIAIIIELFTTALKPKQERKNTVPAEKRAELLRLALMEQFPHETIAELTGLKVDTVEKQLERMGVKLVGGQFEVVDPQIALSVAEAATNFRSAEFPDGIGEGELTALYTTRYEGEEEPAQNVADQLEQEGKPEAKLAEELHGKDNGVQQTMGTIATAGGSQGAVEGTDDAFFARVGKLQAMMDITPESDTEGRANLEKQIEAQWAQYAKKQTKRAEADTATVTPTEEGEDNAVQEQSTDEGNVRQPAGGGEEVGQANAKPQKPARARKAKVEVKPVEEVKQEVVVLAPQEQYEQATAGFPAPAWADLTKDQQDKLSDLARRGQLNLAAVNRFVEAQTEQGKLTNEPYTIDVEARVIDETVAPQVAKLAAPQVTRLENHYGLKSGTAEFLAKIKEDIVLYATKGASAVSAAIRDIIHTMQAGVLSVAMIFNPTGISQIESFIVVPQETKTTQQVVEATVPAEVQGMSEAGKKAYATLVPALKAKNYAKFITIADKPAGMVYVFKADGSLVMQKKALFGLAKGDLYKGNNDLPSNRVTPAGLFGIHVVDAAKGGAAAKTAGEYDFGKVFALDDPDATVTFMHSVWLKESDAARRAAALKNESAADSRYSFGCINLDKNMFRQMVSEYANEMDGSKLFVVPDVQSTVADFLSGNVANDKLVREGVKPVTKTTTTAVQSATTAASVDRTQTGKEEGISLASKSAPSQFMDFEELSDQLMGLDLVREQLEEAGIGHAIDLVSDWELTNDNSAKAEHGSLRTVQGRYVGTLNQAKLGNAGYAAEVARHEIAHAIDMGPHGGIYSAQPEMGVSIVNGKISAEGPVAKELFNLYQTDAKWKKFLAYPFDSTKHPELNNRTKVQLELFAQAFSIYTTPEGRAILEAKAPITAAYFKEVIQDVKSAKPLQIQKAEIAALRAAVLYTRREPKGNRGPSKLLDLNERIDELLASRSQQFNEGLANALLPAIAKPAKSVTSTLMSAARNGLLSAGITEDIVNMASKYMRSAGDYLAAQYARQKTRLEFEMRIERIEEAFERLPKDLQGTGANSVNRYILDSTMSKKWGYYPGEHRIGTELFEVDPDLAKRFKAFPKDAQQVIRDVFDHGYTALKMKQAAISKAVEREFAEREKAAIGDADMLDQLQKERKEMVTRLTSLQNIDFTSPYAYLGRYGDYVVVGKSKEFKHWEERAELDDFDVEQAQGWLAENVSNPDHYVVQFVETQGEADQVAAELIATGKYDMNGTEAGPKEAVNSYTGSDLHLAVARARKLAERQQGEASEASKELDKLLSNLYLLTAAENSARKSEIMRKYVSGADANMMRNLATSGRADAHFLSTMEHNDDITDAMERMRNEARTNQREAMPLYNELFKRQAQSLNYNQPAIWSRALTQASSAWFLATSPAFYLQQIVQTAVLSLPYMSGRLGYFRSARAIIAAYNDMSQLVKGVGVGEHIDFTKAPADVRQMLQTLVGMGKIDIGIDADTKARASEHGPVGKVMRKLQNLNSRIEAVNRATAAIAAYRGHIQRYGAANTDAATKFAAEVVSNTHGSYDGFNTPRVLNSDFGRALGQFKRFQIIQLSMLGKLIHTSFKGASAEEKAIARRALGFIGGHMAILGGALGVPFVQQIGWLMTKLLGDEDEPDDMEYKLRQMIGDKTMADLLLNGVPAALGVNVGGKLGMGNVASILPFTDVDMTSRSGYEKMMVGLMGPFLGGLAPKFADGAGMIAKGEYYKGLELLAPNGIGNAMKGVRYANEGISMRNGDVVLKPDEVSMVDAAFQAVGLPTTTITGRQYVQRTEAEFDKFYNERATAVKGAYVNASREGNGEAMADARQEWQDLQDARRRNGYKIQPMSELFKATVAARKRETSIVNGVETNKGNKQFVAGII